MRTTIALAIVGLTATLAGQSAPADELRLRKINEHRLVIEGWNTRLHPCNTVRPSFIENSWGQRVGAVRSLPGGERAIVDCGRRRGWLELPD